MRTLDAQQAAAPEVEDAVRVEDLISRARVTTPEELRVAVAWTAEIKEKASQVDEKRRSFVDPLKDVIKDIDAFFAPALEALKTAEATLKLRVIEHISGLQAKRARLLTEVAGSPDPAAVLREADAAVPARVPGLSVRESWVGEVTDPRALLAWALEYERDDLLQVNEKALLALTKAGGQDPQIPGWRAYVSRTVAITVSKVKP